MPTPEERLAEMGLTLPAPITLPPTLHLPFTFVNVRGNRAMISGHPRQSAEGSIDGPYGQLGAEMTTDQGYDAAKEIGLSVLSNLKAQISELSRVAGWTRVFGMVNPSTANIDERFKGLREMIQRSAERNRRDSPPVKESASKEAG
ncbi:MAG: hypothetical protein AAF439_09450, partial [Pseudomonadota bacterium]